MDLKKVESINKVLTDYFDKNKSVKRVPAKDMMELFIKKGIFPTDHSQGLPIRNLLRSLDRADKLSLVPFVRAERKMQNTNWFFERTDKRG